MTATATGNFDSCTATLRDAVRDSNLPSRQKIHMSIVVERAMQGMVGLRESMTVSVEITESKFLLEFAD